MTAAETALAEYIDDVAIRNWWNGYLSGISTGLLLATVVFLTKK